MQHEHTHGRLKQRTYDKHGPEDATDQLREHVGTACAADMVGDSRMYSATC